MKELEKTNNHYFTVAKLCTQINVRQLYDRLLLRANQGDQELAAFPDANTDIDLAQGISRAAQLRAYLKKTLGLGKSYKELADLLDRASGPLALARGLGYGVLVLLPANVPGQ